MAPLTRETKIGLNFGQILAVLSLLASMIGGYAALKSDIAILQVESKNSKEWCIRHENANKEDMRVIVLDIKDALREIKQDLKEIKDQ